MTAAWWLVGLALAGPASPPDSWDGGLPPPVTPPAATSAAAASPVGMSPDVAPLLLDDAARLDAARARMADPDRRHEAMVALARIARGTDPALAAPARAALAEALLAAPPDPAWTDVARLLAVGAPPSRRGRGSRARA